LLVLGVALEGGCARDRVEVIDGPGDGDDKITRLLDAVAEAAAQPISPEGFRRFAQTVRDLDDGYDREVARAAERHMVFLALGPLEAAFPEPLAVQAETLALTVWPTALGVEPEESEDAWGYLERICQAELAADCKYVVPERWPLVLGLKVWQTMRKRAREARAACRDCAGDPTFSLALETYDRRVNELSSRAATLRQEMRPQAWPEAGERMAPWSDPPLLVLEPGGGARLGERRVEDWQTAIAAVREDGAGEVLGVYLQPAAEIRVLRAVIEAAATAGYREVALQTRKRDFPYQVGEYRLHIRDRRAKRVQARDVDRIQVLVGDLDAAAAAGPGPYRL
jgi:hypothetical protein